ncbi:sugar phosphate isomerase/epimerase family protein [Haloprofundus halobius]|uniref:sugar phosphate isomerase/epimerase family protein n=1 Tax=Haloprofundus halobius TaxID=2876194 RepID=UPI001CC9ABB5|nr:sugar phosphate isomerase/epimerase family protein [Haloprofundus halobius]
MTDIRSGFVTQTHTGDVTALEAVEQADAFDFDFLELYMDGATERSRLDREAFVAAVDDAGVDVLVHLPFVDLDLGTPRDGVRDAALDEHRACLDAAAELGTEKAVLHASTHATYPEWDAETTHPRMLDAIRRLDDHGRDVGVEVCVENLPSVSFTVHEFDRVFAETDASMTFDTGHARVDGMDAEASAAFLDDHRERVSHVHVNDARGASDEHVPTGSGTTDFETILAPLRENWGGTVSAEVYTFDADYLELSKRKLDEVLA